MSASHTLSIDGATVRGHSDWNIPLKGRTVLPLSTVRIFKSRAELRAWAKRYPDVLASDVERGLVALSR